MKCIIEKVKMVYLEEEKKKKRKAPLSLWIKERT